MSEQSISSRQVSVGTAHTPLGEGMVPGSTLYIHCDNTSNHSLWVGADGVTSSTGFELHKDATTVIHLPERVQLYAVASGTILVTVLQIGGR